MNPYIKWLIVIATLFAIVVVLKVLNHDFDFISYMCAVVVMTVVQLK